MFCIVRFSIFGKMPKKEEKSARGACFIVLVSQTLGFWLCRANSLDTRT